MQDRSNSAFEKVPSRQHGCCSAIKGEGRDARKVLGARGRRGGGVGTETGADGRRLAQAGAGQ